jgi:hypothetical protein
MSITPQVRDELRQRLVDAIAKSFSPCPLIGPKWFRYVGGENPSYLFIGTAMLAKATCGQPKRVAQILIANLSLAGLPVTAQVDSNASIIITALAAKTPPQVLTKPVPQAQKTSKPKPRPPQQAKAVKKSPPALASPADKAKDPQEKVAAMVSQDAPAPKARKSLKF